MTAWMLHFYLYGAPTPGDRFLTIAEGKLSAADIIDVNFGKVRRSCTTDYCNEFNVEELFAVVESNCSAKVNPLASPSESIRGFPGARDFLLVQEFNVEELFSDLKNNDSVKVDPLACPGTFVRGSPGVTSHNIRKAASSIQPLPSGPCPSSESDQSETDQHATNALAAAGEQGPMQPPSLPQFPEPPLYASIRQVLSSNPSYALDVISAVERLPQERRSVLQAYMEYASGSPSGSPKSAAGSSKRPRSDAEGDSNGSRGGNNDASGRSDGGKSNGGDGSGGGNGRTVGGGNTGGDGNTGTDDGMEEDEDGGRRKDGRSSKKRKRNDKNRSWICPYFIAYPGMHRVPPFRSCGCETMTELHLWKSHLEKRHSPDAKEADPEARNNSRFYMDAEQLNNVVEKIDSYNHRPRDQKEWIEYWTDLYRNVWGIIFPEDRYPNLNAPPCPFHLTSDEIASLATHANAVFEAIFDARARRAARISDGAASAPDFRPTEAEIKSMMSEAFAITLRCSPGFKGAAQWLTHASPNIIQAAVARHGEAIASQTGTRTNAQHGEASESGSGGHAAQAVSAATLKTPELATTRLDASQGVSSNSLTLAPLMLFGNGTHIEITVSPVNIAPSQACNRSGRLELTLPETYFVKGVSQVQAEMNEAAADMNEAAADMNEAAADMNEAAADMNEVAADMNEMAANMNDVLPGMPQPPADMSQVAGIMSQVPAGIPQLPADMSQVARIMSQVPAGMPQPPADMSQVAGTMSQVPAGMPQPAASTSQMAAVMSQVSAGVYQVAGTMSHVPDTPAKSWQPVISPNLDCRGYQWYVQLHEYHE